MEDLVFSDLVPVAKISQIVLVSFLALRLKDGFFENFTHRDGIYGIGNDKRHEKVLWLFLLVLALLLFYLLY